VVTNGSIYIEMAHLTVGQEMLLALPDERLPPGSGIDAVAMQASLAATYAPASPVDGEDLEAAAALVLHDDGHRLLPRTIRYIEERRANQARFTGAIETHPSPLAVVWGTEDPIAVAPMATRLHEVRRDAGLVWLQGVGHYPMVEAPDAFASAVLDALDGGASR
jgi:pimeloyl-ACP methyl ester carboxylesterase